MLLSAEVGEEGWSQQGELDHAESPFNATGQTQTALPVIQTSRDSFWACEWQGSVSPLPLHTSVPWFCVTRKISRATETVLQQCNKDGCYAVHYLNAAGQVFDNSFLADINNHVDV